MIEVERDALHLADHAFIETKGSNAQKVEAAIFAYLWGIANKREMFGMTVYPSLQELRDTMTAREVSR